MNQEMFRNFKEKMNMDISKTASEKIRKWRNHLADLGAKMRRSAEAAFEDKDSNKNQNQKGTVLLLELLVCMFILEVIFVMAAPNLRTLGIDQDRQTATETLKRISKAETFHTQIYADGFRSLGVLATIAFPKTCEASGLLNGTDALAAHAHYNFTFTFIGAQTALAPGCTATGYVGYSVTVAPQDANNKRSFYLGADGIVRYSDTTAATSASTAVTW